MRLTRYFLPVLKETPAEAQIVSHRYMLRAGMIKQASAGIYSWLPLGYKVLRNIELDVSIPVIEATCDFCGKCIEWCFQDAIIFVDWEEAALIRKASKIGRFPSPVVGSGR